MLLTIMRHGEAQASRGSDAERPLTERGREEVAAAATALLQTCRDRGLAAPSVLLHSPYTRTTETAGIVGSLLGLSPRPLAALAPGHAPGEVEESEARDIAEQYAHSLLISHQPLVSLMVTRWCGEDTPRYALSPGGFTTLLADSMLPAMASHEFSALPPEYQARF